jgi:butyryl-CoA dehydrogenase
MEDSLYFSDQHIAVRDMVREFAREEVAPVAAKFDASQEFPWENVQKMGELGLLGIPWPVELGGAGLDTLSYMIAIHEMAKVDASHGITISAHTTLGTSPIVNFGTDAQKQRFVPSLASGKVLGGFGLTEPHAGSDAAGTRTTAVKRDGYYVLNGSKIFITHGGVGEVFVATAVTDPTAGTKGISSFILTKEADLSHRPENVTMGHDESLPNMKGFRAGKKEDKLGWRASDTRELIFEDVEVPEENRLGEEGMGFINFMQTLDAGRIGIAALSLGIAEGAFEQSLKYAAERKQFGRPIANFQGIQFQLSDMATELEAGKHLMYHAAWLAMHKRPFGKEAAIA